MSQPALNFKVRKDFAIFTVHSRWFDEKVSSLELNAPLSIIPELSIDQAIKIMNKEGFDQLPVIDENG